MSWELVRQFGLCPPRRPRTTAVGVNLPGGLYNSWHVTCYVSTVVQAWFAAPALREHVLSLRAGVLLYESMALAARYPGDPCYARKVGEARVVCELQQVFVLLSEGAPAVDPLPLVDACDGLPLFGSEHMWQQV